ncbi:MAG: hypothetical protein ACE5K4_06620 [Candidatus Hydrothermarchaeota archaeon]
MYQYLCRSCGYTILAEDELDYKCPVCRSSMIYTGQENEKGRKYECLSCEAVFFTDEKIEPYKCARCNFSFTDWKKRRKEKYV